MTRICTHVTRRCSLYGIAFSSLVAGIAILLTAQGWRSRIPTFDLLTYIYSAHAFLAAGTLPEYGDTSSLGALSAPGTTWLLVPGELIFDDPRLPEYLGAAILDAAALVGLFFLARKYFNTWCACLAVTLYGLSATGIFMAGSLWPIGRPEFLIWMIYLASEWITRRDSRFLAAAVTVWGAGMYVDMAITPALFILPALWVTYRPTIRIKPVFVAGALLALIWFPYLRFEAPRGFADIRSQLLFTSVLSADYASAWCNPSRALRVSDGNTVTPGGAPATNRRSETLVASETTPSVPRRVQNAVNGKLLSNFTAIAEIPGRRAFSVALFLVVALCAILLSTTGGARAPAEADLRPWWRERSIVGVLGLVLSGLALFFVGDAAAASLPASVVSLLHTSGKLLAVGGAGLIAFRGGVHVADLLLRRFGVAFQGEERVRERRLLVISLLVPWLVLVAVAETDKPERFLWLWPLQVLFLAAFVTDVLPRLHTPRLLVWTIIGAFGALLLANGEVLDRTAAWQKDGWAGAEAPEVRVVDYVADQLHGTGKDHAAIGYRLFIYRFMATYHVTNANYKVGADFDLLLRYRQGIANTDRCAEGISSSDEYRIVRVKPRPEAWAPRAFFEVPLDGFRLVRAIGPYRVYERA
jgi:hypothetical protein